MFNVGDIVTFKNKEYGIVVNINEWKNIRFLYKKEYFTEHSFDIYWFNNGMFIHGSSVKIKNPIRYYDRHATFFEKVI